jgi:hypothetical protein
MQYLSDKLLIVSVEEIEEHVGTAVHLRWQRLTGKKIFRGFFTF